MHHLRPTALAGLFLVLVPSAAALSSCGFDYPTDRVNTIAAGANGRDASVDALGIRVLASAQGEGRLIGSLANNLDEDASLVSVSGEGLTAELEEPIEVTGREGVNLLDEPTITVTGDFTAGDVIDLTLSFDTDETVTLEVPVVKPCFQYADIPAAEGESAADAEAEADEEAHSEEGGDATFTCADEAPVPEGGEH